MNKIWVPKYRVIQVTVFFKFSLTDTKKLKNGKTQPFLFRIYVDILIFWCLSMARWKQSCLSGQCQNSMNSLPFKGWARTDISLQTHANTSDIHKHHSYTPIPPPPPPRHYQDISRRQKKPTHNNRHQLTSTDTFSHLQTTPGSVWGCQGVSVGAACFCWLKLVHK